MNKTTITVVLAASLAAVPATAQKKERVPSINQGELVLFEQEGYNGESYMVKKTRPSITLDWNVGSIAVFPGDSWLVCEGARYKEPCMTLTSGEPSLGRITVRSARPSDAK